MKTHKQEMEEAGRRTLETYAMVAQIALITPKLRQMALTQIIGDLLVHAESEGIDPQAVVVAAIERTTL